MPGDFVFLDKHTGATDKVCGGLRLLQQIDVHMTSSNEERRQYADLALPLFSSLTKNARGVTSSDDISRGGLDIAIARKLSVATLRSADLVIPAVGLKIDLAHFSYSCSNPPDNRAKPWRHQRLLGCLEKFRT